MKGRRHTPEQVIRKLREADRLLAAGKATAEVARALEVSENTFHRWRNQYGGMSLPVREERKTWRTLLAAAKRHRVSVVLAGAHGLSGIGRALLGSVSNALVHHSTRPMLVVPATAVGEAHDGPLLLCYDGSDPAKRAIEAAAELCVERHALVLNFWESWAAEAPALAGASKTVHGMAVELDEIANEQSTEEMAAGVELARRAGFEAEGLAERATGPPWMAVLDTAAQHACTGVVVGLRG